MSELTDEQAEVVRVRDRPLLVQAGPGSGKTRTLVAKFLALVQDGVSPERILVLTFSQKAAGEMRQRVELATRRSVKTLWISTFHSFGYDLIQRYPVESGIPRAFRLLTGFKEWVLVRDVVRQVPLTSALVSARDCRGLVGEVANALGLLKQNGVGPEGLEAAAEACGDGLLADLARVYRAYEDELVRRRHFDFRDLIGRATALVERDEVRAATQARFDAVLVDELQDMDRAQGRLVAALTQGSALAERVTACGDTHQSIYGFRGAQPEQVLGAFLEAFPQAAQLALKQNFRSRPEIVALARRVVPDGGVAAGQATDPRAVEVLTHTTSLAEATGIVREILRLRRAERPGGGVYRWRDMAVLCRSLKRDTKAIENELERFGVPYRVHGNAGFYRNEAVAFLVNYVLALTDQESDAALRRVLASPIPGLPQLPIARFLDRVVRRDRHAGRYFWFLRHLMEREDPERWTVFRPVKADAEEAQAELARERESFQHVRPPYFYALMSQAEKQALFEFHERFLILRARARKGRDALPALISAIAVDAGLIPWILRLEEQDPRLAARHAANLTKLHSMVGDFTEIAVEGQGGEPPTLSDLAEHLRELLEHFSNESEVEAPGEEFLEPPDAVSVMTVHQAKGLEFEVVFVPHLVAGRFPSAPRRATVLSDAAVEALQQVEPGFRDPTRLSPDAHYAEEARLFYVAITRARERLILSWAKRYDGEEDDSAPSPFLLQVLGGDESTFWRRVQEEKAAVSDVLAELAAASVEPPIGFRDTEGLAGTLEGALDRDELEVALRRLYQRGGAEVRARLERALGVGDAGLDRAFVTAADPFPDEVRAPLELVPSEVVLSASRLQDFLDCPRKFYYSKLLHLQRGGGQAATFGTAIHAVLEAFHDAHPHKAVFRDPGRLTALREDLERRLWEALSQERESFGSEFQFRRNLAAARAMVEPYLRLQAEEPLEHVAGREVTVEFEAAGAALVAKIDRVCADAPELEGAQQVLIADYKTVRTASNKAPSLQRAIKDGKEVQLVTYYRAYRERFGVAPSYLGKVFLRHTSVWRPGTLQVLLQVVAEKPAKGALFYGRQGRKSTDWGWVSPQELDAAWDALEARIREVYDRGRLLFEITPRAPVCDHCAYSAVCGKEEHGAADG
ncbi:MAG: ATP-dependent DNA helicase [Planctomycetota bacterium]